LSVLDYLDENLFTEVVSSDGDNEIGDNQESDHRSDISNSEKHDAQAVPLGSG
jgi:hypothetical protein